MKGRGGGRAAVQDMEDKTGNILQSPERRREECVQRCLMQNSRNGRDSLAVAASEAAEGRPKSLAGGVQNQLLCTSSGSSKNICMVEGIGGG